MKKSLIFLLTLLFVHTLASAQWTSHLSMRSCTYVTYSSEGPVAGNSSGLFLYASDGSYIKFDKTNRLSDVGITAVESYGDKLFVGYENGNLDVVDVNQFRTYNIPELKNHQSDGSKSINAFYKYGSYVYCASDCGLLQFDPQKMEFKSRFRVNVKLAPAVNGTAICSDSIFVATTEGLYKASLKSQTLENSDEWALCNDSATNISAIAAFDGQIVYSIGNKGGNNIVCTYQNGRHTILTNCAKFMAFAVNESSLLVASSTVIYYFAKGATKSTTQKTINLEGIGKKNISLNSVRYHKDGSILLADNNYGLVFTDVKGSNAYSYFPNGPYSNVNLERIEASPRGVYASGGGHDQSWAFLGRSILMNQYDGSKWSYVLGGVRDAMRIAIDPNNVDTVYFSTWGTGVYKFEEGKITQNYNVGNSALVDAAGGTKYTFTCGICFDDKSNLFVSNTLVPSPFVVRSSSDYEWYTLSYPGCDNVYIDKLVVTSKGHGWATIPRDSRDRTLIVFDTNGTVDDDSDDFYRGGKSDVTDSRDCGEIKLWDEIGEVIATKLKDIVEDRNGMMWIGCEEGILVRKDDESIFTTEKPAFKHIKVPRNDGTIYADYLLDGIEVNCIAVDGANRKWIGTAQNGVYLVSEDGTETIHTFNKSNSPLLSNSVSSIAIHPKTGEVYFLTPYGIVSYAGDAIEPEEVMTEHVRVYPNPVRPDFTGSIKMEGFENGSQVKITDMNGRLVYATTSLGGQATWWNCKGLDGKRVSTGVYLVWVVDKEGKDTSVGKIMVLR